MKFPKKDIKIGIGIMGNHLNSNIQHSHRFPVGQIEFRLDINKGQITECKIFGDFFGVGDVSEIEERLTGVRYERSEIAKALEDMDITHYFGNVSRDEIVELIY